MSEIPPNPSPAAAAPKPPPPKAQAKKRKKQKGSLLRWLIILALLPLVPVLAYRFLPIPGTFLMVERAFGGYKTKRNMVSIEDISPSIVYSVIASEDAKFCQHNGFDWAAIKVAMRSNERGRKLRGGSTISQQTAKNVFLWPQRSYIRKGLEAGFTVLIETFWPKRRIMEAYLNVAEFGPGIFGVEAGALTHFGKHAKDLTPLQAARLAAILPSPRKWSPTNPSRRVARKSNGIVKGARIVREGGLAACVYPKKKKASK